MIAGEVFDFLQGFVDVGLQGVAGDVGAAAGGQGAVVGAESIACEDGHDGFHVEVFAPAHELQQAHAVGGAIAPGAHVGGAIFERADGGFPVPAVFQGVSFDVVAAGEAKEVGF